MISPPETKTLKTLAAVLSGAWIINNPVWLKQSALQKKILPEADYGFQLKSNPFTGLKLYQTPDFIKLCSDPKKQSHQWPKFLKLLWVDCSKAEFTDNESEADYIMCVDDSK